MADYTIMRCLYCGKELALLKRLTGNGEFCSDQHKQNYHDEYNRLALSRLLQAQTKTEEGRAKSGKSAAVPAEAASPANKRGPTLPVPVAQKAELVATAMASFLPEPMAVQEGPHPEAISPSAPFCWSSGPMLPVFGHVDPQAIETVEMDPPVADLLELAIEPSAQSTLVAVETSEAGPFESAPNLYLQREGIVKRDAFDLPMAGPVAMPGIHLAAPAAPELWLVDSQPFFAEVFQLLVPPPAEESVELPTEAAQLRISDGPLKLTEQVSGRGVTDMEVHRRTAAGSDAEDLSRLQNGLRPKSEPGSGGRSPGGARHPETPATPVVDGITLQGLFTAPARRSSRPRANASLESTEGSVAVLQTDVLQEDDTAQRVESAEQEQTVVAEATSPFLQHLIPITLRIVAPAKAKLVSESHPLMVQPEPQLGPAEISPLRPKMGVGKPPSGPEAPPTAKLPSAVKVKPVRSSGEPAMGSARTEPGEQPFDPREAVLAVKRSISAPENKSPAPSPVILTPPLDEKPPAAKTEESTGPLAAEPPKAAKPTESAPAPANQAPVAQGKTQEPAPKLAVESPAPKTEVPISFSSFEAQRGSKEKQSALSKLPLGAKIAIAVGLVLALGGGSYLAFFSSGKTPASTIAQNGSALPGLLAGEVGWVADWAGDTTGRHKGRKISVYQPSLKLTNYKLEFQGKITTNSIGWVFRASDSANYYAVKLAAAGNGYRLLKYSVVDGKETEMGQVPVRPAIGKTLPIRVEVRGDRFTTYIGNNPVDVWVDGQLKSGGVGFVNDPGDRAEITKVGISLLPGPAN